MMTRLQVDKGAIKFILGGANIMCPGFTSSGGRLPDNVVEAEQPVVSLEYTARFCRIYTYFI